MRVSRFVSSVLALALSSVLIVSTADARVGGGSSMGSRGSRTFTTPPSTNTAPKATAPVERSMTQPGSANAMNRPSAPASRGFLGGLFGAGLLGLLFGAGLFGGLGGILSFIGLILQFALIAGLAMFAINYFRNRSQPANASSASYRGKPSSSSSLNDMLNRGTSTPRANAAAPTSAAGLAINQDDYNSFEKLLGDVQTSFGREDTNKLGDLATPEMLSYFSQELADNVRKGVRNELSGVKLLQGDLSEAWREDGSDYATVAMRYAIVDATVDRASGRVVSGDRNVPQQVTEVWTFRRDDRARGQGWQLSAIQQVN